MARWSRATYEAVAYDIAAVALNCKPAPSAEMRAVSQVARRLARRFAEDNPRFDAVRFLRACGVLQEVKPEQ